MNFFAASALVVSLASFSSGFLVFFQNPSHKKNITFLYFALAVGFWSGFYTIWQLAPTAEKALFWARLLMMACAFIPVTQYHHILTLFDAQTKNQWTFLKILYGIAGLMFVFGFSPYFIPGVEPKLQFPFWPIPGLIIHILFVQISIPIFACIRLVSEEMTKSSPLARNQLNWLILSILVGYSGGLTNLPLWYDIPIKPYPTVLSAVMPVTSAFLFFKLGLFDIGLFLRRVFLYVGTCLVTGIVLSGISYFIFRDVNFSFFLAAISLVLPVIFSQMRKTIEKLASGTSFWKESLTLKTIDQNVEKIREATFTYDDLAKNIVSSLLETFPVKMAAVYFYDLTKKELHLHAQRGMANPLVANLRYNRSALSLSENDPLLQQMDGKRTVVNYETLLLEENRRSTRTPQPLMDSLKKIEADICAPFLFQGKVKGMIALGKKNNNTLYNTEDIDAIFAFTRMGEEIMRSIMGMETELRNTSLYSHDMAHDVRSIIQTLEFLVSPMAGNQPREKLTSLINRAKDVALRLQEIFQMNRDRSSLILRVVRGEYEKAPLDIAAVVREAHQKFVFEAERQKIQLIAEVTDKPVMVMGNKNDLIRVFDNLISNALRYVLPGGTVKVKAAPLDESIQITIQDDGAGMEPKSVDKIWDLGWQGKEKKGSAGLGLSIVKQVVEMHKGTIQVASEGPGKGTTFNLKIPIYEAPTT